MRVGAHNAKNKSVFVHSSAMLKGTHKHTHTFLIVLIYLYLPKGLNFSLTSNISLRRKLTTQAESDFIHILRYSDKILVDDPGEKKCSVGDVRRFLFWFLIFIFFFRAETPTKRAKTPTKRAKTPEMRFHVKQ